MMQRILRIGVMGVVLVAPIGGCTFMPTSSSATLPTSAFFTVEPDELQTLQALSKAQDAQIKACHKGRECEDAYYVRGLVALFENRADAISAFQQLHTMMPTSRYDVATIGWLNLLQDTALSSHHSRALKSQLKEEVLHILRERWNTALARQTKETEGRLADLRR